MVEGSRESLQCLPEGANNQVKVDHLTVEKVLTLLLIQKSHGVSKPGKFEEKAKLAELQAKIQFLEQRQRAGNQAEVLKVHEEMAGAKARMELYKSHDEVIAEEGSIHY